MPLDIQKNNREFENIVKEAILNSIRETMPIENILKAYIDVTEELETSIEEEVLIEPMPDRDISNDPMLKNNDEEKIETKDKTNTENIIDKVEQNTKEVNDDNVEKVIDNQKEASNDKDVINTVLDNKQSKIEFSDTDHTIDTLGNKEDVEVPKTEDNLNKLEEQRELNDLLNEDEDDNDSLTIGEDVSLELTDINDLNKPQIINDAPILDDIELLE
jgi:hypothetical protein